MNLSIKKVFNFIIILVLLVLFNINYLQIIASNSLNKNSHNMRAILNEFSRQRGQILSKTGEVIAASDPIADIYKYRRNYPNGLAYATISGYFSLQYATANLEQTENEILSGNDSRLSSNKLFDFFSNREIQGGNVITTINSTLQQTAFEQLRTGCYKHTPCKGALVALKPSTGEILAMVSLPTFDPNILSNRNSTISTNYWNTLVKDKNHPLLNRVTSQLYPPGSTFKIITSIAALETGSTSDTKLTAASKIILPQTITPLTNYDNTVCPEANHGKVSLLTAFAYSCNTAFAQLATEIIPQGDTKLVAVAKRFGINSPHQNIPLAVATSETGIITDKAILGQSSIGQRDVRLTPLQAAEIVATIANKGVRLNPYLIKEIQKPDLTTITITHPSATGQIISQAVDDTIQNFMIAAEQKTYGYNSFPQINIASKTGTAEHGKDNYPHTWYLAYAPVENPVIAIAVVIEDGGGYGETATGGRVAAPIARQVINTAINLGDNL